jgi:Zn-dependent peptidase ImmA (M78 family)/predicted secreted protein
MANSVSEAIRTGVAKAARLHQQLGSQTAMVSRLGSIDVFEVISGLKISLLLRPLNGLLGAYLSAPRPGILVTTERPLSIQRFTAAHELGHFYLEHMPSLDDDTVLRRSPFQNSGFLDLQELEANTFAASFLMPRWLMLQQCKKHGWSGSDFTVASVVYQLSLRLGTSYAATCYTLQRYDLIDPTVAKQLLDASVRELKRELLDDFEPESYRGDVWYLTEADEGSSISGSRTDLFLIRLKEHSSGGYIWNFEQLVESGFLIVQDRREEFDRDGVGNPNFRCVTVQPEEGGRGQVALWERRPWQPNEPLGRLTFQYDLSGPERAGLSRADKKRALLAA